MKFATALEVDFGNNPQKMVFRTSAEIKEWADAEQQGWIELLGDFRDSSLGDQARRIVLQQFSHIDQICNYLKQDPLPAEDSFLLQLQSPFENYKNHKALHLKSVNGKLFSKLFKEASTDFDRRSSIFFLGYLIQYPFDLNNGEIRGAYLRDFLAGITLHVPKTKGKVGSVDAEKASLEELRAGWNQKLLEHEELHTTAVDTYNNITDKIQTTASSQSDEFRGFMEATDKSFKDLKKFYEEDLRMEAPVTYWQAKARKHRIYQGISGVLFIIGIGFAVLFSYSTGLNLSELISVDADSLVQEVIPAQPAILTSSTTPTDSSISLQQTGDSNITAGLIVRLLELIIPFFLIVWLLRIVVKMFLLNSALADDSEERVTMIKTFRSLLEHEDKMDAQDRILMLSALFRPTNAHGDDDGAPPNWFDVLVQRINKP